MCIRDSSRNGASVKSIEILAENRTGLGHLVPSHSIDDVEEWTIVGEPAQILCDEK